MRGSGKTRCVARLAGYRLDGHLLAALIENIINLRPESSVCHGLYRSSRTSLLVRRTTRLSKLLAVFPEGASA